MNYTVAAVRKGTITTVQPFPEDILREEFIPEEPSRTRTNVLIYAIPTPLLIILGFVLIAMKKKTLSYFAFGFSWFPLGLVVTLRESPLGYVFFIIGVVYLTIGLYKWKKTHPAPESNSIT